MRVGQRAHLSSRRMRSVDNEDVRVLFCFTGGTGHALPMMPLARALARRGHEILFTAQPGMLDLVRRLGFDAVDSGGRTLVPSGDRRPLRAPVRADEVRVIRDVFAGRIARERAIKIVAVGAAFQPDVVVRDEVDFGAAAAAELLGIPHASVVVLAAGSMFGPGVLDEPLADLCADLGLSTRPGLLDRFLTIAPVMPLFRDPAAPLPPSSVVIRPDVLEEPTEPDDPAIHRLDAWLGEHLDRPLVYLTLGTIFHLESGDLLPRVLDGLEQIDVTVVATVGRELDPAELGIRENTLIERFIPQRAILRRASAVVCHGGSGTVVSALACGVPLVVLPLGADQPWNADRCTVLGVGRVLDAVSASPAAIAAAVEGVLHLPFYRDEADALRREAASLPSVETAADAVERLTT